MSNSLTLIKKLDLYCIHKLLWDMKTEGKVEDNKIWTEVKELFQSTDYNLQMELREMKTVWGDTSNVDKILHERAMKTIKDHDRET